MPESPCSKGTTGRAEAAKSLGACGECVWRMRVGSLARADAELALPSVPRRRRHSSAIQLWTLVPDKVSLSLSPSLPVSLSPSPSPSLSRSKLRSALSRHNRLLLTRPTSNRKRTNQKSKFVMNPTCDNSIISPHPLVLTSCGQSPGHVPTITLSVSPPPHLFWASQRNILLPPPPPPRPALTSKTCPTLWLPSRATHFDV